MEQIQNLIEVNNTCFYINLKYIINLVMNPKDLFYFEERMFLSKIYFVLNKLSDSELSDERSC